MALPVRQQLVSWSIAAVVFLLLLWLLGNVLLPFLVGGAIAYFLDPVADRLERAGLSRVGATATISLVALVLTVLLVLEVAPPMPSICLPYGSGLPITRKSSLSRAAPGFCADSGKSCRWKKTPLLVPPRM